MNDNVSKSLKDSVETLAQKKAELDDAAASLRESLRMLDNLQANLAEYSERARRIALEAEKIEERLKNENDS